MPYDIVTEARDGYLYFEWSGPVIYDDIEAAWRHVAERCEAERINKALVRTCYESPVPFMVVFDLAARLPDLGFSRGIKVAHVIADDRARELRKFGEDVAVNRGICAGVFSDMEEALAWLLDPRY